MKNNETPKEHINNTIQINAQNSADIYNMLVWPKIKYLREIKWLTQQQLATKAGISETYVSHIETGMKVPKFKTIIKISKALSISFEELAKFSVIQQLNKISCPQLNKERLIEEINKTYQQLFPIETIE